MNHSTEQPVSTEQPKYQRVLYGLPCVGCGCYYASDLGACPVCHCEHRVPAVRPRDEFKF